MWLGTRIAITLAGVAGIALIGLSGAWVMLTDARPENLSIVNEVESADCTVTFEGGEPPWKFIVARNQTTKKFFLFGIPPIVSTVCKSARPVFATVRYNEGSCTGNDRPYAILLTGDQNWEPQFTIQC